MSSFQSRASPRNAAAASLDPPPMPDATGRFFSRLMATGGALLQTTMLAQRVAGFQDQIAAVERDRGGVSSGHAEFVPVGKGSLDPVAEAREHRQAVDQMIAVGAPAGDVQSEIDLGRRELRPRVGIDCFRR